MIVVLSALYRPLARSDFVLSPALGSGLSASHDTATTTGHDLDQMVFFFPALYLIHDFSRIGKTTGYTDLDFGSLIIYRELFDTFFSTDTAFCDLMLASLL